MYLYIFSDSKQKNMQNVCIHWNTTVYVITKMNFFTFFLLFSQNIFCGSLKNWSANASNFCRRQFSFSAICLRLIKKKKKEIPPRLLKHSGQITRAIFTGYSANYSSIHQSIHHFFFSGQQFWLNKKKYKNVRFFVIT